MSEINREIKMGRVNKIDKISRWSLKKKTFTKAIY